VPVVRGEGAPLMSWMTFIPNSGGGPIVSPAERERLEQPPERDDSSPGEEGSPWRSTGGSSMMTRDEQTTPTTRTD
jgi:hypothetical protein